MAHIKFKFDTLNAFCNEAFEKFGFSKEESKIITDVLLLSDIYGIESHGMQRLSRYHKGIEKGMIKVDAKPEIVFETPVSAAQNDTSLPAICSENHASACPAPCPPDFSNPHK